MTPDICFMVFAHVCRIRQTMWYLTLVRDHVWRFYGNCRMRILKTIIK